jgi:serine/threonine-protein kinase RsbW
MTSAASFSCPDTDDDRFSCYGAGADPFNAARLRDEFGRWLRRGGGIDETTLCDIVLAVNEALANSAEFAYLEGGAGTVDLEAVRDPRRRTVTVTDADRGRWRETNPLERQRSRGRGISLMRTLADSVIIDTSGLGTTVCLRFDDAPVAPRDAGDTIGVA